MMNGYKFQKLTPSDSIEMGIYSNAMEYVFQNDDIRNIGISGTYGAGKSSMMETYEKENPKKSFIHISLAHFEENEDVDDKNKEIALEGKIINQLIHQIEQNKIPQTNFKIKKNLDEKKVLLVSLFTTVFVAITCFFKYKVTWENMINGFSIDWLKRLLYFTTTTEIELFLGAVAISVLGIAIYEIIKLQKTSKLFRKLNFQGNEVEVFEDSKDSYFDRYLNEVLYIFQNSGVDGIVFEDIDRYETNLIFEKLREINFLLNKKKSMEEGGGKKQIIRFFYLLRDDMFESKGRTKFFDFILPIVPVVDASNAYDVFLDYFTKANILNVFDKEFLQDLSLYVDDMRVLKNICNEFIIYHECLKTSFTERSNDKLLAMIVYKNLFPEDFGNLQLGRGYVYTLFEQKGNFKENEIKRLQLAIDNLALENEQINSEMCNDIDELNAIYFTIDGRIRVNEKKEKAYNSRKEFVKAIMNSGTVHRFHPSSYSWNVINVDSERKAMEQNDEYIKRKKLITNRNNNKIEKNECKIDEIKTQIEIIEQAYLEDIITRENEKLIFSVNYVNEIGETNRFEEIKRSPYFDLIKFLIRNGYIDETYADYMTYFYANSISANDKTFLRSVTDKVAKKYDYKLDNVPLVVSRMRVIDFKEPEALNFMILDELLSDVEKYKIQLANLLDYVSLEEPTDFVVEFLRRSSARVAFIKEFNANYGSACHWIITNDEFATEEKRRYIADTLCVCTDKVIEANNDGNEIELFVEKDSEFLSVKNINTEILIKRLEKLDIKFEYINFETANYDLLRDVYSRNMYSLNTENVQKVLGYFYGVSQKENILQRSLTLIMSKEEPLCNYLQQNIDFYIESLLSSVSETEDMQDVVIYVLNCEDITEENKKAYIIANKTTISYLNLIEDMELWSEILDQGRILQNIENICDYYYLSGNGMDNKLIEYINKFTTCPMVNSIDLDDKYGKGAKTKLFFSILRSNELDNDKYREMLRSFHLVCANFEEKNIQSDKMEILINCNILRMNIDTLTHIRERYAEECILFIVKNIKEYINIMDQDSFLSSELLQLLDEEIADEYKLKLLQFETMPISIKDKNYSTMIQDYIVEQLYCDEDLEYLLQWYPRERVQLRRHILRLAIESIDFIAESKCLLNVELFIELIKSNQVSNIDKKALLAKQIELGMENAIIITAFEQLGLTEYLRLLEGKRPKVQATQT